MTLTVDSLRDVTEHTSIWRAVHADGPGRRGEAIWWAQCACGAEEAFSDEVAAERWALDHDDCLAEEEW